MRLGILPNSLRARLDSVTFLIMVLEKMCPEVSFLSDNERESECVKSVIDPCVVSDPEFSVRRLFTLFEVVMKNDTEVA